ncbi:MAG: hypothetical protein ABIO82_00365 [Ginsengibacter sp.]
MQHPKKHSKDLMSSSGNILLLIILLSIFESCHPALKFASVKYPASEINRLLDSTQMKYLTIQFESPDAKNFRKPFVLLSYARDSSGGYIGSAEELAPVGETKAASFKGKSILGNMTVEKDSLLSLLSPNGTRIRDFNYLLFQPRRDAKYDYIYYDIFVGVITQSGAGSIKTSARPCPPASNCPARPTP